MKRGRKIQRSHSIGELIVLLFEEAKKVTSNRLEQKVLVYAALNDLLKRRVHSLHPIAMKA